MKQKINSQPTLKPPTLGLGLQPDYRPATPLVLKPPLPRPPSISPAMSPDNKHVRLEGTQVTGASSKK